MHVHPAQWALWRTTKARLHQISNAADNAHGPRSAGPLLTSTTLLPRRAGLWLAKKMGADRVFTDASHDPARASYESRAARTDMASEEASSH